MHFQIPLCVKDSRAIFTFELLLSNTLCHMTGCTIVWDLLSTVFAATFPVRIHVRLKLPPSFARFVTLLTGSHTIMGLFTYYVSQKQGFLHPPSPLRQQWSAFG